MKLRDLNRFIWSLLICSAALGGSWNEHMNNINSMLGRMRTDEEEIKKLVEEKAQAKSKEQLNEILKQIVERYKNLQETHKRFEEERHHVRFEHPEKGDEVERRYRPFRLRTIDQMETEVGLEKKLDRFKAKVETVYKSPDQKKTTLTESEIRRKKYEIPTPTPTPDERPRATY